jgi:hypothetical protein
MLNINTFALILVILFMNTSAQADALKLEPGRVAWDSYQFRNPALIGMASAITFGAWPPRFGNDLRPVDINDYTAISNGALPYVKQHADQAFHLWRTVGFFIIGGVCLIFLSKWRSLRSLSRLRDARP